MVIIKVTPDTCDGDCKYDEYKGSMTIYPCWENNTYMHFGDQKVLCKKVEEISRPDTIYKKGERIKLPVIGEDGKYIYVEYPGGNRIFLDYGKYMKIYHLMKRLDIRSYYLNSIRFTNVPEHDVIYFKPNGQFNEKYIYLWGSADGNPVLTKDGFILNVFGWETILKGECRSINDVVLCYGDP